MRGPVGADTKLVTGFICIIQHGRKENLLSCSSHKRVHNIIMFLNEVGQNYFPKIGGLLFIPDVLSVGIR